jgi:hypothetical protein
MKSAFSLREIDEVAVAVRGEYAEFLRRQHRTTVSLKMWLDTEWRDCGRHERRLWRFVAGLLLENSMAAGGKRLKSNIKKRIESVSSKGAAPRTAGGPA